MRTLFAVLLSMISIVGASTTDTTLVPSKDGFANLTSYSGSNTTLIVSGAATNPSLAWVAFPTTDLSKVKTADLALYVRALSAPGKLEVRRLTAPITAAESSVPRSSVAYDVDNIVASYPIVSSMAYTTISIDLSSLAGGSSPFYGLVLLSNSGLAARFDTREAQYPPSMHLTYLPAATPLNFVGEWSELGLYSKNDAVTFGGGLYAALGSFKGIAPSDVSRWIRVVAPGRDGYDGAPGAVGPKGEIGPMGLKGDKGDSGAVGPQGPKGDSGVAGAAGPQGPQGERGEVGAVGPQGVAGERGEMGPVGPQGPQGVAGERGETGPMGPMGLKGDKGDSGAVGPQGPKGDSGVAGAAGPQGPQGERGEVGAVGPQGVAGERGEMGPVGPQGPQGEIGPQGPAGASVLSAGAIQFEHLASSALDSLFELFLRRMTSTKIVQLAAGGHHSMFLSSGRKVWASGWNEFGQIGDNTVLARALPVPVLENGAQIANVQRIAAGSGHSLFLKYDGTVSGVGWNAYGQLGTGGSDDVPSMIKLRREGNVISGVRQIAAGRYHSLLLLADGTVLVTGRNGGGQLGVGNNANQVAWLEARTENGLVSNAVAVAGGMEHSLILLADGTVLASGSNDLGQLGISGGGSSPWFRTVKKSGIPLTGVKAIAAGFHHSVFLLADGRVLAVGDNSYKQFGLEGGDLVTDPIQVAVDVEVIRAGGDQTFVKTVSGSILSTGGEQSALGGSGSGWRNMVRDGAPIANVSDLAAGLWHTMVVTEDGWVGGTGNNSFGALGDGTMETRSTLVPINVNQ